jgi:hypothetical protein
VENKSVGWDDFLTSLFQIIIGVKMTDIKTKADKVVSAYYDDLAHDPAFHLTGILREVINQLQQSPGVISCADMLELCEEIEKL